MKSISIYKIISLVIFFLFFLEPCYAAGMSIGVYPPIIQAEAIPPATISQQILIINNGEDTTTLSIVYKSFTSSNKQNGEVTYLNQKDFAQTSQEKIFQHVALIDTNNQPVRLLTLAPHQKKNLTLVIDVPQDILLSDYYFSILFLSAGNQTVQGNTSSLGGGVGMHVLLSIGKKGPASGKINMFSSPGFLISGPVPFKVAVTNTNPNLISVQGIITIRNIFGQEIGKVDLLPTDILAEDTRFLPSMADASKVNAVWPEKFLLGPYSAELKIALSDQGPIIKKTIHFFAAPIYLIIGSVIALIFLLIIARRVKNRLK